MERKRLIPFTSWDRMFVERKMFRGTKGKMVVGFQKVQKIVDKDL